MKTLPVTWSSPNLEITESYKFWQRQQAEGEPFDKWLIELRIIASNCEFGTSTDRQLRDKILFGINDDTARQRMLEENNLTLAKTIHICHLMEAMKAQLRVLPLRFTNFTTKVNLKQYVYRVLRIAQTVVLSTGQGNTQHTVKHVTSAGNYIILPLYVEALLLLDLMQSKSMRSQPALHHNQTQAFYEYSLFVGGKNGTSSGQKCSQHYR